MQKITDNIYALVILGMGGTFLLTGSFILIYIRNQHRLLRQRQQLQETQLRHQKVLMESVIASQETERKRIGQDLHDSVGTALSGLRITIEMFGEQLSGPPVDFIGNCRAIIDEVILDVRNISHNLSPPGLLLYGFTGALEELGENISRAGRLKVVIRNKAGGIPGTLKENRAILLYRVMEELLHNTVKHAGASEVFIDFMEEQGFMLVRYQDNGRGMPEKEALKIGMGLQNIESRLDILRAAYSISSEKGNGFSLLLKMKIDEK